jgi:hypothetical protein
MKKRFTEPQSVGTKSPPATKVPSLRTLSLAIASDRHATATHAHCNLPPSVLCVRLRVEPRLSVSLFLLLSGVCNSASSVEYARWHEELPTQSFFFRPVTFVGEDRFFRNRDNQTG